MLTTAMYNVVGVTFENRQAYLQRFYDRYAYGSHHDVRLEREPENQYDKNAIAVYLDMGGDGYRNVGYISRDENVALGGRLRKMKKAYLSSIGPNAKGDIGLTISVEFDD